MKKTWVAFLTSKDIIKLVVICSFFTLKKWANVITIFVAIDNLLAANKLCKSKFEYIPCHEFIGNLQGNLPVIVEAISCPVLFVHVKSAQNTETTEKLASLL